MKGGTKTVIISLALILGGSAIGYIRLNPELSEKVQSIPAQVKLPQINLPQSVQEPPEPELPFPESELASMAQSYARQPLSEDFVEKHVPSSFVGINENSDAEVNAAYQKVNLTPININVSPASWVRVLCLQARVEMRRNNVAQATKYLKASSETMTQLDTWDRWYARKRLNIILAEILTERGSSPTWQGIVKNALEKTEPLGYRVGRLLTDGEDYYLVAATQRLRPDADGQIPTEEFKNIVLEVVSVQNDLKTIAESNTSLFAFESVLRAIIVEGLPTRGLFTNSGPKVVIDYKTAREKGITIPDRDFLEHLHTLVQQINAEQGERNVIRKALLCLTQKQNPDSPTTLITGENSMDVGNQPIRWSLSDKPPTAEGIPSEWRIYSAGEDLEDHGGNPLPKFTEPKAQSNRFYTEADDFVIKIPFFK